VQAHAAHKLHNQYFASLLVVVRNAPRLAHMPPQVMAAPAMGP
jgi:hypothetical protein